MYENVDIKKILGSKIKTLRQINDVTQEELRKELGYRSTGMISQIEDGTKGMSLEQVIKAARFFNVHPAVLVSDVELDSDDLFMLQRLSIVLKKKGKHYASIQTLLKNL